MTHHLGQASSMSDHSITVDLLRIVQTYLKPCQSRSPGVAEVLEKLDFHLTYSQLELDIKPSVPIDKEALLDQSITAITDKALQPIAKQLEQARNKLTWRIDNGLFYSERANVGESYRSGNMHSELIGPEGCVFRDESFRLGLFILAPTTLYRDHNHTAPELYINLTGPCGWRFSPKDWQDFNAGSLIWNPSGLTHATRTYQQPMLSIYSWTKDIKSQCSVIPMDDWSGIERQLTNEKSQNL